MTAADIPGSRARSRERRRYSAIAMVLHWAIAALILTNIAIAWQFRPTMSLHQFNLFQLHKSVGITVLLLSVLRLVWRLMNPPPPYPPTMKPWERSLAHAVHGAFYVIMIGMPLTGWAMVSTAALDLPTLLYKTVPWPHIGPLHSLPPGPKHAANAVAQTSHVWLGYLAYALIVLHVAAALKHQLVDRDGVLWRMLPLGHPPETMETP
jgi:cytochrome b561